jgi:hypothetical protein
MKNKNSLIPNDLIHSIKDLTDDEAGQLFKKILYYFNGEEININRVASLMFDAVKVNIDSINEVYHKKVSTSRENGKKGGRPKKTQQNPEKPRETQKNLQVIEDDRFNEFWELYGKKIDKKKCEAKWNSLNDIQINTILTTLPEYIEANNNVQYRKNPLTYLNGQCWEDDIIKNDVTQNKPQQINNNQTISNARRIYEMSNSLDSKIDILFPDE